VPEPRPEKVNRVQVAFPHHCNTNLLPNESCNSKILNEYHTGQAKNRNHVDKQSDGTKLNKEGENDEKES